MDVLERKERKEKKRKEKKRKEKKRKNTKKSDCVVLKIEKIKFIVLILQN